MIQDHVYLTLPALQYSKCTKKPLQKAGVRLVVHIIAYVMSELVFALKSRIATEKMRRLHCGISP